jgi:hypothetical protein
MEIERTVQQIMQQLLARMEELNAKMGTNQAKVTKQEKMLAEISARMNTNLNEMQEDIKSDLAEMRSALDE